MNDYFLKNEASSLFREVPKLTAKDSKEQIEVYVSWWKRNGESWAEQLHEVITEHRNISHDWTFSSQQVSKINTYLETNKLLADCLNADCYISRQVRQDIEATMLMPQSFIDEYRQKRSNSQP